MLYRAETKVSRDVGAYSTVAQSGRMTKGHDGQIEDALEAKRPVFCLKICSYICYVKNDILYLQSKNGEIMMPRDIFKIQTLWILWQRSQNTYRQYS